MARLYQWKLLSVVTLFVTFDQGYNGNEFFIDIEKITSITNIHYYLPYPMYVGTSFKSFKLMAKYSSTEKCFYYDCARK